MESLDERIGSPLQATHSGIDDPPALVIARGGELAQGHDHTHPMCSVPPWNAERDFHQERVMIPGAGIVRSAATVTR